VSAVPPVPGPQSTAPSQSGASRQADDFESGHDDSGDLRASAIRLTLLAQAVRGEAMMAARPGQLARLEQMADEIEQIAGQLRHAGGGQPEINDTTVDRVARAIHDAECGIDDACQGYEAHGTFDRYVREDSYTAVAHAAIQALREETP